jgi:hypothetical protein
MIGTSLSAATAATASAALECHLQYSLDDSDIPCLDNPVQQVAQSSCEPFLRAQVSKIDTTMPQQFIADYVLKQISTATDSMYRATAISKWHDGLDDEMAVFDISGLNRLPMGASFLALPKKLSEMSADQPIQAYLTVGEKDDDLLSLQRETQHQAIPLTCWLK